jgi:hypothetical protein
MAMGWDGLNVGCKTRNSTCAVASVENNLLNGTVWQQCWFKAVEKACVRRDVSDVYGYLSLPRNGFASVGV